MRSKAHIKSHPLHPILVAFPIAFFVLTLVMDVIMVVSKQELFGQMASYLELSGIIAAVVAAVPGILDYSYTVPPDSSAKKRATQHGLLNVVMLGLFIAAWFLRRNEDHDLLILGLEVSGVILLIISGWLGGTLVHRNQIGIDHRYAGAGKWKEARPDVSDGKAELKELHKLAVDQMMLIRVKGKRIVVGRTEKEFVAFDDHCTHRGGSLADGVMICGTVQCPWHGSQFDVMTGAVNAKPATKKIKTYKIEKEDSKYYLVIG